MSEVAARAKERSGAELVSAALLVMGDEVAANVLRHMDERAIRSISRAMARSRAVDAVAASAAITRLIAELDSPGVITSDSSNYLRRLLVSAFGEEKASDMMERIMRSNDGAVDALSRTDPKILAQKLYGERPQVLAVVLGYTNRSSGLAFLACLPEGTAIEVVYRFALMYSVQPAAMMELREMLAETLGAHLEEHSTTIGGVRNAAELLNGMGELAADKMLDAIRQVDPELADRLREKMFTFDDLLNLSDQALQAILRAVPSERLGPALRATPTTVRERVLGNISKKAADYLRDELDNGPMVTRAEAHAAQRTILEAALRLGREGRISLHGDEDLL
jgi:flagellar motor switch protein FliG